MPACPSCGGDNPAAARFCMRCGARLPADADAPEQVRKLVTILFADVSGFTRLGEHLDVESLKFVMARFFTRMREAVERHGGTVAKFIGDAVMAVFGIQQTHEDDALRAVRASLDMREALTVLNPELERDHGVRLEIRIGLNTGEVVVGEGQSGPDLVVGDAVNLAARLEQVAEPGEIVLGPSTHRLVRDAVIVEPMPPQMLKGKSEPVHALRLLGITPGAAPVLRRLDAPMVGRVRELETLRQTFGRAVFDRACHLVTLLGSAGVGKSRLVEEFLTTLHASVRVLRGHCVSYGEGITFLPILELLRQAASITGQDSIEAGLSKVRALAEGLADASLVVDEIASLLGASGSPPVPQQAQWAVRKLLERLASRFPLVVVFDDVHWGQPTFLDLVEDIAEWSRGVPMLILCTARQELLEARPTWGGGKLNATAMLLEPLTSEEAGLLLGNLIGEGQLSAPIRERIVESAEGNPLFLEEVLAMLVDDRVLSRHNGRWLATGDTGTITLPASIRGLLAARLERLGREERQVIGRAAVVGRVFDRRAVSNLCPQPLREGIDAHLLSLMRKDLILPDDPAGSSDELLRFRHALVREAAYESVAKQLRSELHERYAAWLQDTAPPLSTAEEIIGYHLEQAYRFRIELGPPDEHAREVGRKGAAHLATAGRRASSRGDMSAAVGLLQRARAIITHDIRQRVALLPEIAAALIEAGEFARAAIVVTEALDGASSLGDRSLQTYARLEYERLQMTVNPEGSSERALLTAKEAIALFEGESRDRGLALAWQLLALVHLVRGEIRRHLEALGYALQYAQRLGDRRLEAGIQIAIIGALFFGPATAEECHRHCRRALAWARATGARLPEAIALDGLGLLEAMAGRSGAARALVGDARAILEDLGIKVQLGTVSLVAGAVEMLAGDAAAAERELRNGAEILRAAGEKAVLSTVVADLADAVYAQARYEEAVELTRTSAAVAASDDAFSQVLWRTIRAKVLGRLGRFDDALQLAREGLALAEHTEYVELQARAHRDVSEVLDRAGHQAEAVSERARAARLYEQKGNLVMRDRLSSVLEER